MVAFGVGVFSIEGEDEDFWDGVGMGGRFRV